jgi:protein-tyrosine phosphatase
VCFGNIMRSAMAEFLRRQALMGAGVQEQVRIVSAGLHASPGREAHPWAQQASAELGISLVEHRAKLLTPEMVEQADCILAMDFQNKTELLTLYPASQSKIFMLSAYGEQPWQYREIVDPYLGDLESTRSCSRQLRICIGNLKTSLFPLPYSSHQNPQASP